MPDVLLLCTCVTLEEDTIGIHILPQYHIHCSDCLDISTRYVHSKNDVTCYSRAKSGIDNV